jgi:uncharacterized protein (TIGR02145 family)
LFIGNLAGRDNTGYENTIIGTQAGLFSDGSGHVFLGAFAGLSEMGNNKLYIDNSSTSTPLIYGEFDNDLIRINGKLEINEPVDAQDAATKAYVDLLESTVASLKAEVEALQGVKDIDNNRYDIVTIGTQTWMAENLKTTRYNDGAVIPLGTDNGAWGTASSNGDDAYCWYDNDTSSLITYGALYNWYSIDMSSNGNKNVCPIGWHIPTEGEWDILRDHLDPAASGNNNIAGSKMKEAGLAHWYSPNTGATNDSGFAGLPGGYRSNIGSFIDVGINGTWWSSTVSSSSGAWFRFLSNSDDVVTRLGFNKGSGLSVRCLRD